MKLAVISFTERGSRLNRSVSELLRRGGIDVESTALAKYAESSGLPPLSCSLHDWTGRMFESRDALAAYREHPLHLAAKDTFHHFLASRVSADYEE